ncbi:MAG: M14 family zinc carboxypeptidase [Clostridia bacterium]|nr:M14 family zinc carboxypeptidase [Clostridia bacterium]
MKRFFSMKILPVIILVSFLLISIIPMMGMGSYAFSSQTNTQQSLHLQEEVPQIVKVFTSKKEDTARLADMGLDIAEVKDSYSILVLTANQIGEIEKQGFRYEVVNPDANSLLRSSRGLINGKYHDFASIEQILKDAERNYPDICKLSTIGTSIEGKPIYALKITGNSTSGENKPAIFINGLHHAREWISAEVPLALINELTSKYSTDAKIKELVNSVAIWIVPVVNPDGLIYSQTKFEMWRKNRRLNTGGTYGVDLNRNYSYKWGLTGSSNNPADDTYHGTVPFSEPCTASIRDFAKREKFRTSISFHSYGNYVLYPLGYAYNLTTPDDDLLKSLSAGMAQYNGYKAMRSSELYPAMGDSDDYLYAVEGVLPFTIELGSQFIPPVTEYDKICTDNVKACLYLIDKTRTVHAKNHPDFINGTPSPTPTQKPTETPTPTPLPKSGISGYIKPDLISDNTDIKQGFKIELTGSGKYSFTDETGFFRISDLPAGTNVYELNISKPCYLTRTISNVPGGGETELGTKDQPVDIWAGDIPRDSVQDMAINMSDIVEICGGFNTASGDPKYNLDFDLNRDGAVNMTDILVVIQHFNKAASDYPVIVPKLITPKPTPVSTPTSTSVPTQTPLPTDGNGYTLWDGASHIYKVGDKVNYQGTGYECIREHTSNIAWDPVSTLNVLWKKVG